VTKLYGSAVLESWRFDAGTSISASATSPVKESVLTQHVCTGWTGTGSARASGKASSVLFVVNEPSSIAWKWEIHYLPVVLAVIITLAVLAKSAMYVLLRRKLKGKRA
jgi:hypothetical protein